MSQPPLLLIDDLHVQFNTQAGVVRAVDGVSYAVPRGRTVAVVGESGCGKSVTAMSILRLVERARGEVPQGRILFEGRDLLQLDEAAIRKIRGNEIGMIFQEPMTSLNPVYTVGDQVGEALQIHQGLGDAATREEVLFLLELVGIPSPENRIDEYPHQLSGGMRQRVMIAMALSCRPKLLIADEPTTALDVTIQAQILRLIASLQRRLGMSVLLITHDLAVVAQVAHDVVVMYAGRVVESGSVVQVFKHPQHPYTAGLLRSLPHASASHDRLPTIAGSVPDAMHFPVGCRFHPRCAHAMDACRQETPPLRRRELRGAAEAEASGSHLSACYYVDAHPGAVLGDLPKAQAGQS